MSSCNFPYKVSIDFNGIYSYQSEVSCSMDLMSLFSEIASEIICGGNEFDSYTISAQTKQLVAQIEELTNSNESEMILEEMLGKISRMPELSWGPKFYIETIHGAIAIKLLCFGNTERAINIINEMKNEFDTKNKNEALCKMIEILSKNKQYADALKVLDLIDEPEKMNFKKLGQYFLALGYLHNQQFEEALKDVGQLKNMHFNRSDRKDVNYISIIQQAVDGLIDSGQFEKALEAAELMLLEKVDFNVGRISPEYFAELKEKVGKVVLSDALDKCISYTEAFQANLSLPRDICPHVPLYVTTINSILQKMKERGLADNSLLAERVTSMKNEFDRAHKDANDLAEAVRLLGDAYWLNTRSGQSYLGFGDK